MPSEAEARAADATAASATTSEARPQGLRQTRWTRRLRTKRVEHILQSEELRTRICSSRQCRWESHLRQRRLQLRNVILRCAERRLDSAQAGGRHRHIIVTAWCMVGQWHSWKNSKHLYGIHQVTPPLPPCSVCCLCLSFCLRLIYIAFSVGGGCFHTNFHFSCSLGCLRGCTTTAHMTRVCRGRLLLFIVIFIIFLLLLVFVFFLLWWMTQPVFQ
mmetsp:Transcript_75532/g.179435  ORF Transcript_75532/g.179435 Transcript_75532/m.179435 type:complete len:216 (+) Transcript_75532:273-920(+)